MKKQFNFFRLVVSIAIPLFVEVVSGFITMYKIDSWYVLLEKPSFTPPNYLFAPIWTFIYVLMGISFYMVWQAITDAETKMKVFFIFGLQLFFNFWWSVIFFYFHEIAFAFVDIVVLLVFVLWMILLFKQIRPAAGYLQIPYFLWLIYAALINYGIWALN